MYFFNEVTEKLHIEGYCRHSKIKPHKMKEFRTEQEAYEYAGIHIHMCKLCQKKKEEKLRGEK